ncbi:MAG: GNAT family N-acetyltransferase [Ignavibacteria bacterium]|nr:GNAT family N-acetyltransferase [Ignavibacteria bacterium]
MNYLNALAKGMTEAIAEMVRFSFDKMNLHTIEANLDPTNIASIKLLEKSGFVKEGHIRELLSERSFYGYGCLLNNK